MATSANRTDTTRYLCAAVHLDPSFRRKVLGAILDNDYRAFGTSPGVDLVPVVKYALAIRRRKLWRDIVLAVLLLAVLLIPSLLILAILAAFAVVLAEAWITRSRMARTLTRGRFAPDALQVRVGQRLEETLKAVTAAQEGNTVVYSGYSPFVGSGSEIPGWSFAINVQNAKEDLRGGLQPEPFELRELYDAVTRSLTEIGFVGLSVEDKLYVNGAEVGQDPLFLPAKYSRPRSTMDPSIVSAFLETPTLATRYYKCVRVTSWKGELVLSMFFRFSRTGPSLFVESSHFVLPPLRERYHKVDSYHPQLTLRQALELFGESLAAMPFLWLGSWFLLGWRPIQHLLRWQQRAAVRVAIQENAMFDYGATPSLREAAMSTNYRQYFQKLDHEMYFKTIERQLLECLTQFLDSKNIDTSDLKSRQTTILNSGVLVSGGSVTADNLVVGAGGKLVQGVARAAGIPAGAARAEAPVAAGR